MVFPAAGQSDSIKHLLLGGNGAPRTPRHVSAAVPVLEEWLGRSHYGWG